MLAVQEAGSIGAIGADRDRSLHVLIVEDDTADAHLIELALEEIPKIGFVEIARDGVEALAYLDAGFVSPDLAIVDLNLPRLDGFGLLTEIGERYDCKFPILVLTSSAASEDIARSVSRGARHVISKPRTLEELESVLRTAIATL